MLNKIQERIKIQNIMFALVVYEFCATCHRRIATTVMGANVVLVFEKKGTHDVNPRALHTLPLNSKMA